MLTVEQIVQTWFDEVIAPISVDVYACHQEGKFVPLEVVRPYLPELIARLTA